MNQPWMGNTCKSMADCNLEYFMHQMMWMMRSMFTLLESEWVCNLTNKSKGKLGFPRSSVGKESACNARELGLISGLGRSPAEGNGNPLQYSCLENPTDRGVWQATIHGIARVGHNLATKPPTTTRLMADRLTNKRWQS